MSAHPWSKRITKIGTSPAIFECGHCGKQDDPSGLMNSRDCTKVYEPCNHCGQTEECAKDCSGISGILGSDSVHVCSGDEKTDQFYNDHDNSGELQ